MWVRLKVILNILNSCNIKFIITWESYRTVWDPHVIMSVILYASETLDTFFFIERVQDYLIFLNFDLYFSNQHLIINHLFLWLSVMALLNNIPHYFVSWQYDVNLSCEIMHILSPFLLSNWFKSRVL